MVQIWMEIYQEELIADWNLAFKDDDVLKLNHLDKKWNKY
ncbi:hypothetical protein [Candidatus Ruthia endofausta]|nr:hypothetical protein [Candidatus Ruthia endofausta]